MQKTFGGVGEVVNTLVCGTSIRGFDSHTPPHIKKVLFEPTSNLKKVNFIVGLLFMQIT